MSELNDEELLSALGVETDTETNSASNTYESKIIAGFEEIVQFYREYQFLPTHGEDRDIRERVLAVRFDRIKSNNEIVAILKNYDTYGILEINNQINEVIIDKINDEELLSELGVILPEEKDITKLKNVKTRAEKRIVEDIAKRIPCLDFEKFKPYFQQIQNELQANQRQAVEFKKSKDIEQGDVFILGGQKAMVATLGEEFMTEYGMNNRRLRIVYDNGTESDMLMLSFLRALYKDSTARKIIDLSEIGPLFSGISTEEDIASGTVYVLRSKSNHPLISQNHEIIHKIGITGNKVNSRIANAELDPTFLMAEVEVIATYELSNINRVKLENIIHKFFESTRLEIEIKDRFGNPVVPKEWFLVPLFIIDEAIQRIKDGTIVNCVYDVKNVKIVEKIKK